MLLIVNIAYLLDTLVLKCTGGSFGDEVFDVLLSFEGGRVDGCMFVWNTGVDDICRCYKCEKKKWIFRSIIMA